MFAIHEVYFVLGRKYTSLREMVLFLKFIHLNEMVHILNISWFFLFSFTSPPSCFSPSLDPFAYFLFSLCLQHIMFTFVVCVWYTHDTFYTLLWPLALSQSPYLGPLSIGKRYVSLLIEPNIIYKPHFNIRSSIRWPHPFLINKSLKNQTFSS